MKGFWQEHRKLVILTAFALSVVLAVGYVHIYAFVWGLELPKTYLLKREKASLSTQMRLLDHELDQYATSLEAIKIRDEEIYRSIFGLNSIPDAARDAGIPNGNRAEMLAKKAYVQSKSFDEISLMLANADNMATSIPAISPLLPGSGDQRISSSYGYRHHPVLGTRLFHEGIDFSLKQGTPVYVTGDGVIESIRFDMFGYGRQVLVNHGFGYKTRYAHLKMIFVVEGMKVQRGMQIATTGNTGLTSGPHLHYEVIYKGRAVNPRNYFDTDLTPEQYREMTGMK